jgi:hypothetical protein
MPRFRIPFRWATIVWLALVVISFVVGMAAERWFEQRRTPPPEYHYPPCHPGCFPAGTSIDVPTGTMPIERVARGDRIVTVGADGVRSTSEVMEIFATKNRLVEVHTDLGNLITTRTQPLALVGGALRAAGELQSGDRILRFQGERNREATVSSVSATAREELVYNLILADPTRFVANGFVVRSKPPAPR